MITHIVHLNIKSQFSCHLRLTIFVLQFIPPPKRYRIKSCTPYHLQSLLYG